MAKKPLLAREFFAKPHKAVCAAKYGKASLQISLMSQFLASHRELKTSRRIRRIYDYLAEELRRG